MAEYFSLTQNWIREQLRNLRRYDWIVLAERTKELTHEEASRCITPPRQPRGTLRLRERARSRIGLHPVLYPSFARTLKSEGAVLMHAHFGPYGYYALPLAEAARIPVITSFYGYDLSRIPRQYPRWRDRYARLFQRGELFLVEGPHMASQLEVLGCPREKIRVHPLGIDVLHFPLKERADAPYCRLRVLMAGRFTEKKGLEFGLEAFARAVRSGVDAELTIIGGHSPKDAEGAAIRSRLDILTRRYGISDLVSFWGFQSHDVLCEAYQTHDVLLVPSVQAASGDNEGGAPVTVIEAMATGMAVIGTRHCDIPELVRHERTGLLAPERDVDAMASALTRLTADSQMRLGLGKAAHELVSTTYSSAEQGKRLESIYDAVLSDRAAAA